MASSSNVPPDSASGFPNQPLHQISAEEWYDWQIRVEVANQNNIFHHCKTCDREWVASDYEACACGSRQVEHIACWQFPDG